MPSTRTITTVAVGLALALPGAAAAQHDLRTPDARAAGIEPSQPITDLRTPDARDGVPDGSAPAPVVTIPRTRVVEVEQTGFDWSDASIGSAAVLAVFLTAGGLAVTIRQRRQPAAH